MIIKEGSTYTHHKNGGRYKVIGIANDVTPNNPDHPPVVVYRGESNGLLWTKSIKDFEEKMSLAPMRLNEHSP